MYSPDFDDITCASVERYRDSKPVWSNTSPRRVRISMTMQHAGSHAVGGAITGWKESWLVARPTLLAQRTRIVAAQVSTSLSAIEPRERYHYGSIRERTVLVVTIVSSRIGLSNTHADFGCHAGINCGQIPQLIQERQIGEIRLGLRLIVSRKRRWGHICCRRRVYRGQDRAIPVVSTR